MKIRDNVIRVASFAMALFLAWSLVACEGGSEAQKTEQNKGADPQVLVPIGNGVVYGTVVDAQTGEGIVDASVVIQIGTTGTLTTKTVVAGATTPPAAPPPPPPPGAAVQAAPGVYLDSAKGVKAQEGEGAASEATGESEAPARVYGTAGQIASKAGDFIVDKVPTGTHTLTISKDGFATISQLVTIPPSDDTVYVPVSDSGESVTKMSKAFDAKVVVTMDGRPVAKALVVVTPRGLQGDPSRDISANTDDAGIVIVKGLPQNAGSFNVLIPAVDANGDGVIDYSTYLDYFYYRGPQTVWPIAVSQIVRGGDVRMIGSVCDTYASMATLDDDDQGRWLPPRTPYCVIQKANKLYFVFNRPLTIAEGANVTLVDSTAGVAAPVEVAATAAMSAEGVVMTITPSAELVENHVYGLKADSKFRFTYTSGAMLKNYDWPMTPIYVTSEAPLNETEIIADNYNGKTGAGGVLQVGNIFIKFPKVVAGTIQFKSFIFEDRPMPPQVNVALPISGDMRSDKNDNGCNAAGCKTDALYYKVALMAGNAQVFLGDNGAGNPAKTNSVTVHITATDAQGNNIDKDLTLPVY